MTYASGLASAALGGVLIGCAAIGMMCLVGRIAGVSGIVARLIARRPDRQSAAGLAFLLGLLLAPLALPAGDGFGRIGSITSDWGAVLAAGGVGFGTVMGSGCTSGHGICGLARWSRRSLAATFVFMASAVITVIFARFGL